MIKMLAEYRFLARERRLLPLTVVFHLLEWTFAYSVRPSSIGSVDYFSHAPLCGTVSCPRQRVAKKSMLECKTKKICMHTLVA